MICGWAHVLHALYKPWGQASPTYYIQHMSLFVTTFVFTMGLLFKVGGVDAGVGSYQFLTVIMLLLCIAFAVVWVVAMVRSVFTTVKSRRLSRKASKVDSFGLFGEGVSQRFKFGLSSSSLLSDGKDDASVAPAVVGDDDNDRDDDVDKPGVQHSLKARDMAAATGDMVTMNPMAVAVGGGGGDMGGAAPTNAWVGNPLFGSASDSGSRRRRSIALGYDAQAGSTKRLFSMTMVANERAGKVNAGTPAPPEPDPSVLAQAGGALKFFRSPGSAAATRR